MFQKPNVRYILKPVIYIILDFIHSPARRRNLMPTYEYQCKECAEKFERIEHIDEHDASKPTCPKCGGKEVVQILDTFIAKTARKS